MMCFTSRQQGEVNQDPAGAQQSSSCHEQPQNFIPFPPNHEGQSEEEGGCPQAALGPAACEDERNPA